MEVKELEKICSEITYKPGSNIDCFLLPWGDEIEIRITIPTLGSAVDPTKQPSPIVSIIYIGRRLDKNQVIHSIYQQIRMMEMHELDEWLKIEGKLFKNPHPEKEHGRELWKQ